MNHPRPRLVLSRCLELAACRYDGSTIRARFVRLLAPHVDLVPVCPEVEIGLGVPRAPVRLVHVGGEPHLQQPATGRDVTDDMRAFAAGFLDTLGEVDGFLLKSRSPSCGMKDVKVYPGTQGAAPAGKGVGLFAAAVLERHPDVAVEDEGRLTNFRLRHHFLTRLFASAALREVGTMAELVAFQASAKLLLMAHHEAGMRALGRIVANADQHPFPAVVTAYRARFAQALAHPARPGPMINALQHAQGFAADALSASEKAHFASLLEEYQRKRIPLSAPLAVLQGWIARLGLDYLARQRLFDPYPRELMTLADSGAGDEL